MRDREAFTRTYLTVEVVGPARSGVVADLLERAADVLRRSGELTVTHLAFETSDHAVDATTALTVYYDRTERRRVDRY